MPITERERKGQIYALICETAYRCSQGKEKFIDIHAWFSREAKALRSEWRDSDDPAMRAGDGQ